MSRGDLTVRPLPIEDVLLRELIVRVLRDLIPDVDHDRWDHALLGGIAGDGLRVAGDEAVRRVHVGGAVLADRVAPQVIAVLVHGGHDLEHDMWVARPQRDRGTDDMAQIHDARIRDAVRTGRTRTSGHRRRTGARRARREGQRDPDEPAGGDGTAERSMEHAQPLSRREDRSTLRAEGYGAALKRTQTPLRGPTRSPASATEEGSRLRRGLWPRGRRGHRRSSAKPGCRPRADGR